MTEHEQARQWRERRGLSRQQLADLTGYSYEAVCLFERGVTPARSRGGKKVKSEPIRPYTWQRWRTCCAGVEAKLQGLDFKWMLGPAQNY